MDEGDRMSTLPQRQKLNDIHSKCAKCVRGDQEGIKRGREEEECKRETENGERSEGRDEMGFLPRTNSWGEGEGRTGWTNDPEKEMIRDT